MKTFARIFFIYSMILAMLISDDITAPAKAQDQSFPYIGIVQTEKLRVLPNRGTNYREIATLDQNDLVTVLNRVGDWLLITPPEDITCWMSSQFVGDDIVVGNNVNVRQGPGLNFPVLTQISKGTKVTIIKQKDNWTQIAPPDTIQAWVNSDFVAYFSSKETLTSTLQRMEDSKALFNQAVLYAKSEISKDDPRSINFEQINEKFFDLIENYPDTIYARNALFELESIQQKKDKIEADLRERERQVRVKELFAIADDFAKQELEKRNVDEIDETQIKFRYIELIKEFPDKEEAKWAVERMAMVRKRIEEAREEQSEDRKNAFDQAEEFRNQELLRDISLIDFNAIIAKYRSIIVLYPDTPEARRSEERIEDIKQRQSYAHIKANPNDKSASSLYAYEGFLVLDDRTGVDQTLYAIEERGFLHKESLCFFYSNDPNIKAYLNKKVKVEGTITSFDQNNIPILGRKTDTITIMTKQHNTKTFNGGIHPDLDPALLGNKEYAQIALPEKVRIPIQQHIGAPAKPIVKVGDSVTEGQKIAEATGFVSANIHATISGKVTAIKKFPVSIFKQATCIEISSDGTAPSDWKIETLDWRTLSVDKLKDRIIEAGIVGMGGATFPTHVKLSPPDTKNIDLIVANGVECEPYLDTDRNTMCTVPTKVFEGLQILMKILNCKKGIIGIESDTPDAIEIMKKTVAGSDSVSVLPLEVKYPQGAEKQLIYVASKREVPSGGLPMDVGVMVSNVATMAAVYDAVTANKPLISRSLTLVGHCLEKSVNITVPIGTLLSYVIDQLGGFIKEPSKIISGGPMMGEVQYTIDVPITKGTSGIIFQAEDEAVTYSMGPCIRCGRCVDICPMGISPAQICQAIEFGDFELAKKCGLLDCIKCGSCSYICPANREMVQLIKFGEQQLKKKGS